MSAAENHTHLQPEDSSSKSPGDSKSTFSIARYKRVLQPLLHAPGELLLIYDSAGKLALRLSSARPVSSSSSSKSSQRFSEPVVRTVLIKGVQVARVVATTGVDAKAQRREELVDAAADLIRIVFEMEESSVGSTSDGSDAAANDGGAGDLQAMKANLMATVSHELRTPLTSMIGYSDMLIRGVAGQMKAEQLEYVHTIRERGWALLRIISQMLEASQIEAGMDQLVLQQCNIDDLIEASICRLDDELAKARVQLRVSRPYGLPPVIVDPERIIGALMSIISNSVKFSDEGALVEISVDAKSDGEICLDDPSELEIGVRDNGVGIPAHCLDEIFQPFYQVDSSATRSSGGMGLGLSLAKQNVMAHGGKIWAESVVSQGTKLCFTLPIRSLLSPTEDLKVENTSAE